MVSIARPQHLYEFMDYNSCWTDMNKRHKNENITVQDHQPSTSLRTTHFPSAPETRMTFYT